MLKLQEDPESKGLQNTSNGIQNLFILLELGFADKMDMKFYASSYLRLNQNDLMTHGEVVLYYDQVFKKKTAVEMRTKWHSKDKFVLVWVVVMYCQLHSIHHLQLTPQHWKLVGLLLNMKEEFLMRKWITIIRHTTHSHQWTLEEENTLWECMENQNQQYHWSDIAIKIYQEGHGSVLRTCKDIREHWNNHMNPALKKCAWSKSQDELLLELVKLNGKKWSLISKSIEGRTQNQVKNRYFSIIKKNLLGDEQVSTQQSHSQSDKFEIPEIIEHIEFPQYVESPFVFDDNVIQTIDPFSFQMDTNNLNVFWDF